MYNRPRKAGVAGKEIVISTTHQDLAGLLDDLIDELAIVPFLQRTLNRVCDDFGAGKLAFVFADDVDAFYKFDPLPDDQVGEFSGIGIGEAVIGVGESGKSFSRHKGLLLCYGQPRGFRVGIKPTWPPLAAFDDG